MEYLANGQLLGKTPTPIDQLIGAILATGQKPNRSRTEFIKRIGEMRPEVQTKLAGNAQDGNYKLADTTLYTKALAPAGTTRVDLIKTGIGKKLGIRSFTAEGQVDNLTCMVVDKLCLLGGIAAAISGGAAASTDIAILSADLQRLNLVNGLEQLINGELTIQVDNNYHIQGMPLSRFLTIANGQTILRDGELVLDNPFVIHPNSTVKAEILMDNGDNIAANAFLSLEFIGSGTLRR